MPAPLLNPPPYCAATLRVKVELLMFSKYAAVIMNHGVIRGGRRCPPGRYVAGWESRVGLPRCSVCPRGFHLVNEMGEYSQRQQSICVVSSLLFIM